MFKMFMRNKHQVSLFAAIFVLLALASGAYADIRLILEYPPDVPPSIVSLDFYAGVPTGSGSQESSFPTAFENAATITRIRPEIVDGNTWIIKQPGTYCYYVRPRVPNPTVFDEGRVYSVLKVIWIDPTEWSGGASTYGNGSITKTLRMPIKTGPMARNGFEPTWDRFLPRLGEMPYNYTGKTDSRDRIQGLLPDEMDSIYGTGDLVGYPAGGFRTPVFVNQPRAMYQAATQDEMVNFTKEIAANSPKAHWFTLSDAINNATGQPFGKTPYLQYDIPIIIVTTENIPAGATFEQAAKIVRESGKLNFWHNAQIHANETSSGEGAMALLLDMVGPYGDTKLDRLNYICIPRYNVEGSYIWQRSNAQNIDMNRDHMRLKTVETRMIHKAYLELMPHVCDDGHEYDFFSVARSTVIPNTGATANSRDLAGLPQMAMYNKSGSSSMNGDDMQTTPASSLNNPSWEVNDLAMELYGVNVYNTATTSGLRIYHYGETSNNSIGRAYMGLMGSVSFVVEIRGLGAGPVNYERRTFSHYLTAKTLLETAYNDHERTKTLIAQGRQAMIDKGKVFGEPDDVIALTFGTSTAATATRPGKNIIPYTGYRITHNMKGEEVSRTVTSNATRYNNITRSRPRPTAYIIPKGITRSTSDGITTITAANGYAINYEYLIDLLKWQGIHYYEIAPGSRALARKYFRSDTGNTTTVTTIRADLRAEAEVSFDQGAYVIPMDQVSGAVIAMLFEPDTDGSGGYNSSVAQTVSGSEGFALIYHDLTTRDYPYYRFEKDNPRDLLVNIHAPTSLTLNKKSIFLLNGSSEMLTATVLPETSNNKDVIWSSDNERTAIVNSSGLVTAVGPGTAYITATTVDGGFSDTCHVYVATGATSITLSPTAVSIDVGDTYWLTATIEPFNVSNAGIVWRSSNTAVATVNQVGIVTAVGGGTATITATAADNSGISASCTVNVISYVTGVELSRSILHIQVGNSAILTATVLPEDATNKAVTWSIGDASIATVDQNGRITAVSPGSTVVTVTTVEGGFTATCIVSVQNQVGDTTIEDNERSRIHRRVEELSGDVGNVYNPALVDPNSLIGALLVGATYDSISRGGTAPTAYPFPVSNTSTNQNEYDRKTAKSAWVEQLSQSLGFPVVVRRQPDKFVYAEFGDPDAPEMVMALSHLDSPTGSISAAQNNRWRGPDLLIGPASAYYPNQYKSPYVHEGWLYGAGVQDDSGPTLATLLAAKALMDVGLPLDRRIRIVMGLYEDGGPGTPSVANTQNFMSIPLYTSGGSFYDNWTYKYLNREEMPIAGYTSDSRFPVIIGNTGAATLTPSIILSSDAGKPFRLLAATAGVTARSGDVTLKDIVYGSATQIASRAVFTIDVSSASPASEDSFVETIKAAAAAKGWSTVNSATDIAKVDVLTSGDNLVITINTDVAMEYPAPMYSSNAIVWGMHLISEALGAQGVRSSDLQLKKAAEGIADLFFRGGVEDYIGTYMGIPANLLRNANNGAPNLTIPFFGGINTENPMSFYTASSFTLSIPMQIRSMHFNSANFTAAITPVRNAFIGKGFTIGAAPSFSNPTLYLSHNNPLTALQFASYNASMNHDPAAFADLYHLLGVTYPHGTTGGTLATDYFNKMTAFGAIIPGNERWWHTANERISISSIVQMTKLMADGMLEMARYSGPAGAKLMWADMPGLNTDRADLDLLDVTIGTYKDAQNAVLPSYYVGDRFFGATSFDIPMFSGRNSANRTDAGFTAGHGSGGIYLPVASLPAGTTYVLPMRLEFKAKKPAGMSDITWKFIMEEDIDTIAPLFSFNILNGSTVEPLTTPVGENPSKFFYKRISQYDPDTLYLSVHAAIKDDADTSLSTIITDSKTDLYSLNPAYSGADPFPARSVKTQRGFFVFGDGSRNARFTSPSAIFATLSDIGVTLDKHSIALYDGDSETLVATVVPYTAPDLRVTWSSSNTSVATVTNGVVTAVGPGIATITVTTVEGGKTASCEVSVVSLVTGVILDRTAASILFGQTLQLTETVLPVNAGNKNVTWTCDSPFVASVDQNGLVTTVGTGSAIITVTTEDGRFSATCQVLVTTPVSRIVMNPTTVSIESGDMYMLEATVEPFNASPAIQWSSSNTAVATINQAGILRGVGAGTATITVAALDGSGVTGTCSVTVTNSSPSPSPTSGAALPIGNAFDVAEPLIITPADTTDATTAINMLTAKMPSLKPTDLYVNKFGVIAVLDSIVNGIVKNLLGVDADEIFTLPIFEASVEAPGNIAVITFDLKGTDLLANAPEKVLLLKVISSEYGEFVKYVNNPADYADKTFTIRDTSNNIFTGSIVPADTYKLVVFIKDGGAFDLDGKEDGVVFDPLAIIRIAEKVDPIVETNNGEAMNTTAETAKKTNSSNGNGCNVGLGLLAFAMVPFALRKKSK